MVIEYMGYAIRRLDHRTIEVTDTSNFWGRFNSWNAAIDWVESTPQTIASHPVGEPEWKLRAG